MPVLITHLQFQPSLETALNFTLSPPILTTMDLWDIVLLNNCIRQIAANLIVKYACLCPDRLSW